MSLAFAARGRRSRWPRTLLCLAMAADFLLAVADASGCSGPPASPASPGVTLLVGLRVARAAAGTGLLLAADSTAMTISLPAAQQFRYTVVVLCLAMLALASLEVPVARRNGRGPPVDAAGAARAVPPRLRLICSTYQAARR